MGVSVTGAYSSKTGRYHVFCDDNADQLGLAMAEHELLVTFNGIGFDNKVLEACYGWDLSVDKHYDLLVEVWIAHGLGPEFRYPSHIGYGLDACLKANFPDISKTGFGAMAPVLWQRGQIGQVIDYCLNDVMMTKKLFDAVLNDIELLSPKTLKPMHLRKPF
jgi:hypothetical protein